MPRAAAACRAVAPSRDAIATTSQRAACRIGGTTFSRAILAVPSTPNLSLRMSRLPAAGRDRQSRPRRQARPRSHGEELCRETQYLAYDTRQRPKIMEENVEATVGRRGR